MPNPQIQRIYDDLSQRGLLRTSPTLQQLGHELRLRGLVYDPTQGGTVTPARLPDGIAGLHMAEDQLAQATAPAPPTDPATLKRIMWELGRIRNNEYIGHAAQELNYPVTMRQNGTVQALPQNVASQAQQKIDRGRALTQYRNSLQQRAEALQQQDLRERYYAPPSQVLARLSHPSTATPTSSKVDPAAIRAFMKQGPVTKQTAPPPFQRLTAPSKGPSQTTTQRELAKVNSQLAQLPPKPNTFDAHFGEMARRWAQAAFPRVFSTDPAFEALLNKLSVEQAIDAQSDAQSAYDYLFPGASQVAAETPGALGAARELALGFVSPTNLAITAATMGTNKLLELPEILSSLRMAQAQKVVTEFMATEEDLLSAKEAGDAAAEATHTSIAQQHYEKLLNLQRQGIRYGDVADAVAPFRHLPNTLLKGLAVIQGGANTATAAADLNLLKKDPQKYWARVGGGAALASAPFWMHHAINGLGTLMDNAFDSTSVRPSSVNVNPGMSSEALTRGSAGPIRSAGPVVDPNGPYPAPFYPGSDVSPLLTAARQAPLLPARFAASSFSGGPSATDLPPLRAPELSAGPNRVAPPPDVAAPGTSLSLTDPTPAMRPPLSAQPAAPLESNVPPSLSMVPASQPSLPTQTGLSTSSATVANPSAPRLSMAEPQASGAELDARPSLPQLPAPPSVRSEPLQPGSWVATPDGSRHYVAAVPGPHFAMISDEATGKIDMAPTTALTSVPFEPTHLMATNDGPVPVRVTGGIGRIANTVQANGETNRIHEALLTSLSSPHSDAMSSLPNPPVVPSSQPQSMSPDSASGRSAVAPRSTMQPTAPSTAVAIADKPSTPLATREAPSVLSTSTPSTAVASPGTSAVPSAPSVPTPLATSSTQSTLSSPARPEPLKPGTWAATPDGKRHYVIASPAPHFAVTRSEANGKLATFPTKSLTSVPFEPTHSLFTQQGSVPVRVTSSTGPIASIVRSNGQGGIVLSRRVRPLSENGDVSGSNLVPGFSASPVPGQTSGFPANSASPQRLAQTSLPTTTPAQQQTGSPVPVQNAVLPTNPTILPVNRPEPTAQTPLQRAIALTMQMAPAPTASPLRPGDWVAMPHGDRYFVENTGRPDYTIARSESTGKLMQLPTHALTPVPFEATHMLSMPQGNQFVRVPNDNTRMSFTTVVKVNGQRHTVSRAWLRKLTPYASDASTSMVPSTVSSPSQGDVPTHRLPTAEIAPGYHSPGVPLSSRGELPISIEDLPGRAMSQDDFAKALDMYKNTRDKTIQEIAEEFNVNYSTLKVKLRRAAEKSKDGFGRYKLKEQEEDLVKMYMEDKMSSWKIADKLNRAHSTIYDALRRALQRKGILLRSKSEAKALFLAMGGHWGIHVPYRSKKTGEMEYADSTYELAYMQELDSDRTVKTWTKRGDYVPYGDGKHYVPDFHIEYTDGRKKVVEIKPISFLLHPKVQAKAQAATPHYNAQDKEYSILTENNIGTDKIRNIDVDSLTEASEETKEQIRKAIKHVRYPKTLLPKDVDELLAGEHDPGNARDEDFDGTDTEGHTTDEGTSETGFIDSTRVNSTTGTTDLLHRGRVGEADGGSRSGDRETAETDRGEGQTSLDTDGQLSGTMAEGAITPDYSNAYLLALKRNYAQPEFRVENVFHGDALQRVIRSMPIAVLKVPIIFDVYLPDDVIAVTRIYTYPSGEQSLEIRINSRLLFHPDTLAFYTAHEVAHCGSIMRGHLYNARNEQDYEKIPAEIAANNAARFIVGFEQPQGMIRTHRSLPENGKVSSGNDLILRLSALVRQAAGAKAQTLSESASANTTRHSLSISTPSLPPLRQGDWVQDFAGNQYIVQGYSNPTVVWVLNTETGLVSKMKRSFLRSTIFEPTHFMQYGGSPIPVQYIDGDNDKVRVQRENGSVHSVDSKLLARLPQNKMR